jgi:hypothetical protein
MPPRRGWIIFWDGFSAMIPRLTALSWVAVALVNAGVSGVLAGILYLTSFHSGGSLDSLSPLKRGEGWGEGC